MTIAPGSEVSTLDVGAEPGVADHRALDLAAAGVGLDDHPRVVGGGELDRRVELALGAEHARDPDARAEPRRLHPERPRHRRRVLAPAGLADLAELDLRQAPEGEQPLADQLVHRHRGGEHARARVGDVERSRAGPGRVPSSPNGPCRTGNGDVAAEQAARGAHLDLLAVGEPAPVAVDQHLDHLVAGLAQARRRPRRRTRSETSCSDERPPRDHRDLHRVRGVVVVVSWSSVVVVVRRRGRRLGLDEVADDDRHRSPAWTRDPADGACSSTRPSSRRSSVSCSTTSTLEARGSRAMRSAASSDWPTTSGTITEPAPVETTIVTVSPRSSLEPGRRVLVDHRALGLVGVAGVDVRDQPELARAAPRRPPAGRRATSGSVIRFGALGDEQGDGRLALDLARRPAAWSRSRCPASRRARPGPGLRRAAAAFSRSWRRVLLGQPGRRRGTLIRRPEADRERRPSSPRRPRCRPAGPAR